MASLVLSVVALVMTVLVISARPRITYLSELMNSFLPYSFSLIGLMLIVSTMLIGEVSGIESILLLVGWASLLVLPWSLLSFGFISPVGVKSDKSNLRVVCFNKLFTNDNIEGI